MKKRAVKKPPKKKWKVYMIQAASGALYTGITTDVNRRFKQHETGVSGAKFFRTTKPLGIVYRRTCKSQSEALKIEIKIKKMSRAQKVKLICSSA